MAFPTFGAQVGLPTILPNLFVPILFERTRNTFINSTDYHDFCEFLTGSAGQQSYTPVTVSDSLEIVSNSANDTAAGTGTRTVGIAYLNAAGEWSEATVTMNGTTPVSVPIAATAINFMHAKTGGSLQTSAGTINLRNVATPTILYEQIAAGGNMSQSGRFTVPAGYYAVVHDYIVSAQSQPVEVKIRALQNPFDQSANNRWLFKKGFKIAADNYIRGQFSNFYLAAGQSLKVSGIPDATQNGRVFGSLEIELVKL
jgi:hypothetical protein